MNRPRFIFALIVSLFLLVPINAQSIRERDIRAELGFLASDAMQGRGSGTIYERIAAEYIGSRFQQFGLEPGGDTDTAGNKSFVQRVPVQTAASGAPLTVIGILRGSHPTEAIMLSAHIDHLVINEAVTGDDKIFNGADDDAS